MTFDWHGGLISHSTEIDAGYNVRRFLLAQCGAQFGFDRALMAWIRDGGAKTMGDVVTEWRRRHSVALAANTRP